MWDMQVGSERLKWEGTEAKSNCQEAEKRAESVMGRAERLQIRLTTSDDLNEIIEERRREGEAVKDAALLAVERLESDKRILEERARRHTRLIDNAEAKCLAAEAAGKESDDRKKMAELQEKEVELKMRALADAAIIGQKEAED